MEELGLVTAVRGNRAFLRVSGGSCGGCRSCSAGRGQEFTVEVWNHLKLRPGDRARLSLPDRVAGMAGLVLFGLPLACGAVGLLWLGAGGAAFFFLASFPLVAFYDRRLARRPAWRLVRREDP